MNEYSIGSIEQIPPGEGRQFVIGETTVAVFNSRNGSVYATEPHCPHMGGPLVEGLLGGSTLICPFHGWKFDLETGSVLLGSCSLTTYPSRLSPEGEVFVTLES